MSSTPVAVAASDPGAEGGLRAEPKRERAAGAAGGSDVAMTEASEEAAAVAEVKEEGALAPGHGAALVEDAVGEEAAMAAAPVDPLYATEFAGMVVAEEGCQEEPSNGAQGLDGGGDGGSERLETEAGALAGQTEERKPVPAGDVAESSELGEHQGSNSISEPFELGNDNGVAHFDEGTQNGPANSVHCARYSLPPLDKEGFRVSDLVWGKVKSHPWWPGEIFDPSNASELALKHQKKGTRLVAYFGDSSFAWCDESQLKPFVTNYSQMEKQSSSDSFVGSVNYALEELSRRILSGMSCSCLPEELSDNGMSYMVENAGLKDGVTCSTVNRSEMLTCFSPENLLHYIRSLALFPGQGGDLLELVIACSQLTSFYRSKGCPELASFQTGSAWVEDVVDTSPTKSVVVEEVVVPEVPPVEVKPKRGRGRPRKHKPEDNLELTAKKSSLSNNNASYNPPQSVKDFDESNKKKRSLDSFEDSDAKSPTPAFGGSFKIGECIRRAATQLTGSSSVGKAQNEVTAEVENAEFDVSSDDAVNELTVEKRAKRRRMHRHHILEPKELFSQLCSVAVEPMDKYVSSAMLISYFSDYRNYVVSATTEANIIEKSASKRGRKRKVLPSPEVETTDHMQDSYWSGLSLHNHPIHSLKRAAANTRPSRRRKSLYNTVLSSEQHEEMTPKKQIQVIERSIIHVDEKIVDEWKPTALVLSFGRSTALPSETDLVKKFGRYGPLKESENEVQKNTNTVKIVFKKRADAERAFSDAGKYGTFGPSLRSYRLVNMPFSLGVSEPNKPELCPGDHGPEVPGPSKSEVSLDTVKVNHVDTTEKSETVKAPSGEQVETVKKTCETEPGKESSREQVQTVQQACQPEADMVKKTGQIDTELAGPSDQIATATHNGQAETVTDESSEQVSTSKQASLEKQSEIALSGAATAAVQVVGTIEPDREEPLNKSAKQVTEADTENEVPEETRAPREFQAQSSAEKPLEQDATEQTLEIQAPKEASVEIPRDVKLESKSLTEETVDQVATEQVKVPSDSVPSDTSDVQGSDLQPETDTVQGVTEASVQEEQEGTTAEADTVQGVTEASVQEEQEGTAAEADTVQGVTEASVQEEQEGTAAEADTVQGVAEASVQEEQEGTAAEADAVQGVTEASVQEAGPNKQGVEAKTAEVAAEQVSCPEQTVRVEDIIDASGGHTDVGKQTAGEMITAEVMIEETVESKIEAPVKETVEDKATAGTLVEAVEGKTTSEAPDERITEAGNTVDDVTVEAPVKKAATVEKTIEGVTVEAPHEKATAAEKTTEGVVVEVPHEEATETERTEEDAVVEAPDEKATTAEKPIEDAMVEAPHEQAATASRTVEDATVEAPDEIAVTSEKTAEDATVEAPHDKATTAVEDATVEAADVQVGGVAEHTS